MQITKGLLTLILSILHISNIWLGWNIGVAWNILSNNIITYIRDIYTVYINHKTYFYYYHNNYLLVLCLWRRGQINIIEYMNTLRCIKLVKMSQTSDHCIILTQESLQMYNKVWFWLYRMSYDHLSAHSLL